MRGRSIKIFLVDGTASGIRTAEIGLSTIKALVVPRASLLNIAERSEPQKTGIYILIGIDSDNIGIKKIYIGEGDIIITRLKKHNKDELMDFWEEAVLFVSKDENLTKAHVRYLEARLISLAKEAKRARLVNGTAPSEQGKIPEADQVEMEEFISQAMLLLGTLGYDLFEPSKISPSCSVNNDPEEINHIVYPEFSYTGDGFSAKCLVDIDAGKFIVKAKSTARKQEASSLQQSTKALREQLIESGVLDDNGMEKSYEFSQDYTFSYISSAAQVVSGTSVNGRNAWKLGNKSYAEWQESKFEVTTEQSGQA